MNDDIYNLILIIPGVFIAAALVITAWRMILGPNSMDRLISVDGFVAMMQCGLALYIVWTFDTTVVNAMLVLALLGFISNVSVARFRKRDGA